MKIIIDAQKLYDELYKINQVRCFEYMIDELTDILTGAGYPEWAEKKTKTRVATIDGEYTLLFEAVWKEYPKKVGKGTAFAEWKKLIKKIEESNLKNLIVKSLEWQNELWKKDNFKYVPLFENYLKGRRWEDEPPKKTKYLTPDGIWAEK